ncbi:MAG: hypothetical protein HY236_17035 [Acidobacteria bacterium]|nr:hypothetical protein [Acidobacteriota bacterium]
MMKSLFLLGLLCFLPVTGMGQRLEELRDQVRALELLERRPDIMSEELVNRRAQALKSHTLLRRMAMMARAWNDLVADLGQGKVNVKKFGKVKRAWRELEKTEGWSH